ncbi:hypothetical protein E5A73_02980 [Sphingomonas gei]|uniref:Uncharacterized protein n=1 Tax=Sphingomonas gei TaxID=1395960 RepID=A0A4V3QZY9_9SPHN|nr:hypothetical protein [Sphingomonas gei]TGX56082.1 hypothetical protein E5A73_02980 [Sphingomonas gei]
MYDFGVRQALSGHRGAYHPQQANQCPGCGKSHWMIGRVTAECAFCGTALPLMGGFSSGNGMMRPRTIPALAPLAA